MKKKSSKKRGYRKKSSTRKSNSRVKPKPEQVVPSPAWTIEKGVSYSLLSKFINCRERFRIRYVEGVREEKTGKDAMDWGTYFHELLELHAKYPTLSPEAISRKCNSPLPRLEKKIADTVFDEYCHHYAESRYNYVDQECEFDVDYRLPNGRDVRLVGKSDEIIASPNNDGLWIQENKTKSKINEYKIESGVPYDLQSLMYAIAIGQHFNKPVTGIVYNVIRKPSSSPKKIKMKPAELAAYKKKNPKSKALMRQEKEPEFLKRLAKEIENDPHHYFMRWELLLTKEHVERWRRHVFDPILTQLCQWWDSVKHDPFSPWTTPDPTVFDPKGMRKIPLVPNPHHFMRPFGVYDGMTTGTGDYFDYITRNRKLGLLYNQPPFPELSHVD